MAFRVPEHLRVVRGPHGTTKAAGNNGAFLIPPSVAHKRAGFWVIASDGMGWRHVSVSTNGRCPTWPEMCFIKDMFWTEDECVIQYHPPKSEYINNHPYCLHLWQPIDVVLPMPDTIMVGISNAWS